MADCQENIENGKKELKKRKIKKITVYIPPSLLKEMDEFKEKKGYTTRSAMLRSCFRIAKHVLTSTSESEGGILSNQLNRIEQRLDELFLEKTLIDRKDELIDTKLNETTELEYDFDAIGEEIHDIIKDPKKFNGSVKDFVVIDYFKYKYSRGVIFHVLSRLKEKGIIELKNGVWKIN